MRRPWILILVLIIVLAVGGFLVYQQNMNSARAAVANRQTATITRGNLVATVSGAGNISAPQQTNLNFQLTGVPITQVSVGVGDKVKAGQVLAQVDDSDLQFALRSAQSNLVSAQAKLDALKQPPSQTDVAAARAQLASAQSSYNAAVAKNSHASDQITVAKSALEKATVTLQQAQAAYNAVSWRSDIGMLSQSTTLQQATIDYQTALANYNLAVADINDTGVKSAAQQVAQANASLTKLLTPTSAQDLQVAESAVDSAKVSVDQATRKLDQAKIIAPFDGTVAAVNYVIGQLSATNATTPMITLVNLDNLQTQVNLSEVDIAKVKPDAQVTLTFDALARQSFPGKIVSISPVGTVTQGVVNYLITIALTKPNPSIKPGMTAEANIVVDRRSNVLLAPNRAVKTQGNQKTITILSEGHEIPLVVQTGLNNDQDTEIVSTSASGGQQVALNEGDTVVLNPTTTTTGNRGFGGPGGFIFSGGR